MPDDCDETATTIPTHRERLREVALVFTKLGFTAFGGPAAHVGLMEEEFVHRRKWLDRERFLDLISAVNFIPGPNSTEIAIHLGLIRAGFAGLVLAGVCFITPAVLIILPIAYCYVKYGSLPQVEPAMYGVSIAVTAIVIVATWRLLRNHRRDAWSLGLVVFATLAWFALRLRNVPQPDLLILLFAGVLGAIRHWVRRNFNLRFFSVVPLAVFQAYPEEVRGLIATIIFFLKIGMTLFGSGYVLVTYLQTGLVDQKHWLTQQQMLDAIAVGQFTPGPLLTTATFVGYLLGATRFGNSPLNGTIFAVAATVAIFLPAFVLIAALAPVLAKLRSFEVSSGVFDHLNSAVLGLLLATCVQLLWVGMMQAQTTQSRCIHFVAIAVAMALLLRGLNATWVILVAALAGYLLL